MARPKITPVERFLARDQRPLKQRQSVKRSTDISDTDKKRERALDLRAKHHSYQSISKIMSEELGIPVSVSRAAEWVNHAYEQRRASCTQLSMQIRDEENEQLDQLLERWMPLAIHEGLVVEGVKGEGDKEKTIRLESWDAGTKAASVVLKILETKAKINGLMTMKLELPKSADLTPNLTQVLVQIIQQTNEQSRLNQNLPGTSGGTHQPRPNPPALRDVSHESEEWEKAD